MQKLHLIKNWVYDPAKPQNIDAPGHFALASMDRKVGTVTARKSHDPAMENYSYFLKCREEFNKIWNDEDEGRSILYCHEDNAGVKIEDFFKRFEAIPALNIALKDKSKFYSTENAAITAIKVSPFWNDRMRKQLFTVLLRSACYHNVGANIDSALNTQGSYSQMILPAIQRFMQGYTKFAEVCFDRLNDNLRNGIVKQFQIGGDFTYSKQEMEMLLSK